MAMVISTASSATGREAEESKGESAHHSTALSMGGGGFSVNSGSNSAGHRRQFAWDDSGFETATMETLESAVTRGWPRGLRALRIEDVVVLEGSPAAAMLKALPSMCPDLQVLHVVGAEVPPDVLVAMLSPPPGHRGGATTAPSLKAVRLTPGEGMENKVAAALLHHHGASLVACHIAGTELNDDGVAHLTTVTGLQHLILDCTHGVRVGVQHCT